MYIELRKAHWYVVERDNARRQEDRLRVYPHDTLSVQCLLDLDDGEVCRVEARINAWNWRRVTATGPQAWGTDGFRSTADEVRRALMDYGYLDVEMREVE